MNSRLPLLRSLDPWHQRIGLLGVVALNATRDLDTPEALTARIDTMLFEKVYTGSTEYERLWARVPAPRRETLLKEAKNRSEEDDPAAILRPLARAGEWFKVGELWINDERVPSPIGLVSERKSYRVVDLARMVGLLLPTHELSELGWLLQLFLERDMRIVRNPLIPDPSIETRLLYLFLLLQSDCLWPVLLRTMARDLRDQQPMRTRTVTGTTKLSLLRKSVDELLRVASVGSDIRDIDELRPIGEYLEAISNSQSTEENYLRPRMELLLDLGFITRNEPPPGGSKHFVWSLTPSGYRMADLLAELAESPAQMGDFLNRRFFTVSAQAYELPARSRVTTDSEIMLWFARAFKQVGREYGFTPGKTVSLAACLLALKEDRVLELGAVSDCVYRAPHNEFGGFLRFSGGSRLDREFLIRVRPELEAHCLNLLGAN